MTHRKEYKFSNKILETSKLKSKQFTVYGLNSFNKIYTLLSLHERKRAGLLLGMILVMSLLDAIGIASVMPFLSVLANPEVVTQNEFLALIYTYLEFENEQSYLFFLGLMVFFFSVVGSPRGGCDLF